MLRNCKVPRVLPRIVECAKKDRNAILRARYNFTVQVPGSTVPCVFVVIHLFPKLGVANMHLKSLNIGLMLLKYNDRLISMKTLLDAVWLMQ